MLLWLALFMLLENPLCEGQSDEVEENQRPSIFSAKKTRRRRSPIDISKDETEEAIPESKLTTLRFPYDQVEEGTFANMSATVSSIESLTACFAVMIEALTDGNDAEYDYLQIFQLLDPLENELASAFFEIGSAYTSLEFQDVFLYKLKTGLVEPSTWMRICYSLDFVTGKVTLVFNGELVETKK